MTETAKGLRVILANPTGDPGHVLFDAPGRKGQIPTTQEAQANVEYINRLIEEDERRLQPFHPCGPDYTSPDGKWIAPQLMDPVNEARKKLGLSEFTGEDFWNMGERNVRLMYYALTDRLPDEVDVT